MNKVYKEIDIDLSILSDLNVSVIGYGIQGRAQALNLRDSGINVTIGNIHDDYRKKAKDDGFLTLDIDKACSQADVIMLLIPDESHNDIVSNYVIGNIKHGALLIIAHGYSIRYNKVKFPDNINISMLAPRFPGKPIRDKYLDGTGVPAFFDVIQDYSGDTLEKTISIGCQIGYGRVGMLPVSYIEETELDLFVEHFIGPLFISTIEKSLKFLTEKGYSSIPAAMELYLSGERGSMWTAYAREGLFNALNKSASPTCKFGISSYYEETFNDMLADQMEKVIKAIKDGEFAEKLKSEESDNYKNVSKFFKDKQEGILSQTEREVAELLNSYL